MSIKVDGISKQFGAFRALDNVSLEFPRGELTALLGPSGCGKTTLLRIIAGLDYADSGRVLLDGADTTHAHVREREVGFVFQHYALFRHMSVFENIAFGLRVKPRASRKPEADIRARVEELLSLVQLRHLADRYPSQLSGGQRQRVALARALAVEPRVMLLDEPFGALDAQVRKELRRWLRQLHEELHITSIFVTHDQEEALDVADRIVVMNKGVVEQVAPPSEIYERPATPFVFSFLGTTNTFRGRIEGDRVRIGDTLVGKASLGLGGRQLVNGADVVAFARPHETEIAVDTKADGIPAQVLRVRRMGKIANVELTGKSGANGSSEPAVFEVELTAERLAELGLVAGQPVRLLGRRAHVFDGNGAGH